MPLPIVVLISGRGSNLQSLIDARAAGPPVEIRAVISNRPDVLGLERARNAGIETVSLDHKNFPSRQAFDAELQRVIDQFKPALVVLAGFMRILTSEFVDHYQGRMINIHPALLPRFPGLNTHQRAIDAGESEHGATVHYVTADVDGGPTILQASVPIVAGDTAEVLAARVLEQEHQILPKVVGWFAEGRLAYRDGKAFLDGAEINLAGAAPSPR